MNLQTDLSTKRFAQLYKALKNVEANIVKYSHLYLKAWEADFNGGSYQLSDRCWTWQRLQGDLYEEIQRRYPQQFAAEMEKAGYPADYNFGDLVA